MAVLGGRVGVLVSYRFGDESFDGDVAAVDGTSDKKRVVIFLALGLAISRTFKVVRCFGAENSHGLAANCVVRCRCSLVYPFGCNCR
jgi:hypothetical protein